MISLHGLQLHLLQKQQQQQQPVSCSADLGFRPCELWESHVRGGSSCLSCLLNVPVWKMRNLKASCPEIVVPDNEIELTNPSAYSSVPDGLSWLQGIMVPIYVILWKGCNDKGLTAELHGCLNRSLCTTTQCHTNPPLWFMISDRRIAESVISAQCQDDLHPCLSSNWALRTVLEKTFVSGGARSARSGGVTPRGGPAVSAQQVNFFSASLRVRILFSK